MWLSSVLSGCSVVIFGSGVGGAVAGEFVEDLIDGFGSRLSRVSAAMRSCPVAAM